MNLDFGLRLVELLQELRAARVKGDKQAVEAAGRSLDEHVGSPGQLFRFFDERRRKCKPTWAMEQIIWYVECEHRRPGPHSLRAVLGMLSGEHEFDACRRWLEDANTGQADSAEALTMRARIIRGKLLSLGEGEAMTLPEIQEWYETVATLPAGTPASLDEGTWKRVRKELLPYGLKNRRNVGYYIEK